VGRKEPVLKCAGTNARPGRCGVSAERVAVFGVSHAIEWERAANKSNVVQPKCERVVTVGNRGVRQRPGLAAVCVRASNRVCNKCRGVRQRAWGQASNHNNQAVREGKAGNQRASRCKGKCNATAVQPNNTRVNNRSKNRNGVNNRNNNRIK